MCVFEQPASGVTDGKAYLGKSGKELKEALPEVPLSFFTSVVVTDSKGGHFIVFQVTPVTPPPRHKKKRAATMINSLGDGPKGSIVFDVDKKKVVNKEAKPFFMNPTYVSSKEPMTMYIAQISPDISLLNKLSFEGDSVSKGAKEV